MVVQMEPIRVKSLFRSLLVFALAAHRKKMNQEALRALLYNSFENRRMGDVVINVRIPWVYSAINKRWHQNVVRTSVTNSTAPCCYPFLFLQKFWRHLRVLTEQTRGNIYLSSRRRAIYSLLSKFSLWHLREERRGMDRWKRAFFQFLTSPPTFLVSFLRSYMDWKSLLHQNISHSFDVSVTIIWGMSCCVSTRSGVIRVSSSRYLALPLMWLVSKWNIDYNQ